MKTIQKTEDLTIDNLNHRLMVDSDGNQYWRSQIIQDLIDYLKWWHYTQTKYYFLIRQV